MVTSFGYSINPPPKADVTIDVRDLSHNPHDPKWEQRIAEIVSKGGRSIAIGCEKGCHRSVAIAEEVARRLDQSVQHRDQRWPTKRVGERLAKVMTSLENRG